MLGDINQDGIIDQTDVDLCRNSYLGTVTLTSEQIKLGDIDEDGTISLNDMVLIEDYINEPDKSQYIGKVGTKITTQITWMYFDEEEGNIDIASNTSLGLVKGTAYNSTTKAGFGKVSVDSKTGEMTVNGLDTLEYIPLAGTETNKPVTGTVVFDSGSGGDIKGELKVGSYYTMRGLPVNSGHQGRLEFAGWNNVGAGVDELVDISFSQYKNNTLENEALILDENGNTILPRSLTVSRSYKNTLVMGGDSDNRDDIWIDNRSPDGTVDSHMNLHKPGILGISKTYNGLSPIYYGGVGLAQISETTYKATMQWNNNEECVEFVFA